MKNLFYLFVLLFGLFSFSSFGQVLINEYSAANLDDFHDNYNKYEDWIELYNTSSTDLNIGGWFLSDKTNNPQRWEIPAGTIIPANGFLVFWCSGRDEEINGNYHTNFRLTQSDGSNIVSLSLPDGSLVESFPIPPCQLGHSRCRANDGDDEWRFAIVPTPGMSNSFGPQKIRYTESPSMDVAAGFYESAQLITLSNNEPNSVLRYTLDGTNPKPNSLIYSDPILIETTTVLKARSYSNENQIFPGQMVFNTYFINEDFGMAVFSLAGSDLLELADGDDLVVPFSSLEYFNLNQEREATSFGTMGRHGEGSWDLPQRGFDWISRDEMSYSKAVYARLFEFSERDEYQKFMFRCSGSDNYPATSSNIYNGSTHLKDEYVQTLSHLGGLELDHRATERVILFLNGEYWGLYSLRDRPADHDYTKYYYDQGKYDIQYLRTWDQTEFKYGGLQAKTDWGVIRDFILENEITFPADYQFVSDDINMLSLIDYMIVNLNTISTDWLNYNTAWWRGLNPAGDHQKWGYTLWDMDAVFGYHINYSGIPNVEEDAAPCDLEAISDYMDDFYGTFAVGMHEKIFLKLLDDNAVFKQLYYSRQADLINTVFSCDNMISTLDSLVAVIAPEMPAHIERWGGSVMEWEANVQAMKDFIELRCSLFEEKMMDCYQELSGPFELTLKTEPSGVGAIDLNTLSLSTLPWSGNYFGGMENLVHASVLPEFEGEWQFSHWESSQGNIITDATEPEASISLTQFDTLTAVFSTYSAIVDAGESIDLSVFPNPTKDQVTLEFELLESGFIQLELQNNLGQKVMSFPNEDGTRPVGLHQIPLSFSKKNLGAGVYILVIRVDAEQIIRKIVLMD